MTSLSDVKEHALYALLWNLHQNGKTIDLTDEKIIENLSFESYSSVEKLIMDLYVMGKGYVSKIPIPDVEFEYEKNINMTKFIKYYHYDSVEENQFFQNLNFCSLDYLSEKFFPGNIATHIIKQAIQIVEKEPSIIEFKQKPIVIKKKMEKEIILEHLKNNDILVFSGNFAIEGAAYVLFLITLKILYKDNIFLLRGRHEN